jgi:hypothetical protein
LHAKKQKGSTKKGASTGAEASENQQKAVTRAQKRAEEAKNSQHTTVPKRRTRSQKTAELLHDQLQMDAATHM